MSSIDISKKFVSINIGLLTISDTRSLNDDKSGDLLNDKIINFGHKVKNRQIIKDDVSLIKKTILELSNDKLIDAIITTGGTGLTGRDSTPEAVESIAHKIISGFGELFRQVSYEEIGTSTIQSRAVAGLANHTIIFCMPGSTGACNTAWNKIIQAQLDSTQKPCNFVSQLKVVEQEVDLCKTRG